MQTVPYELANHKKVHSTLGICKEKIDKTMGKIYKMYPNENPENFCWQIIGKFSTDIWKTLGKKFETSQKILRTKYSLRIFLKFSRNFPQALVLAIYKLFTN